MEKIFQKLWLSVEIHKAFKEKCKDENITMQRKFIELISNYLKI